MVRYGLAIVLRGAKALQTRKKSANGFENLVLQGLASILKILKVIMYTKNYSILNSDWLRKECSSPVTRMQFCNSSGNYGF